MPLSSDDVKDLPRGMPVPGQLFMMTLAHMPLLLLSRTRLEFIVPINETWLCMTTGERTDGSPFMEFMITPHIWRQQQMLILS